MCLRYMYNPSKCKGYISTLYLELNEYEIIGQKISYWLLEKKLKNDKNFIPHLLVVEKSCKRKGREIRLEIMYKTIEYVRFRECVEIEVDDSNI